MAFDGNKKRKYFSSSLVDRPLDDHKSQKRHCYTNQISLKTNVNVSLVEQSSNQRGGIELTSDFFDKPFYHPFYKCRHFARIKTFDQTKNWRLSNADTEEQAMFQYLMDNRDSTLEAFNTCFPSFNDEKSRTLTCLCSALLLVIYDRPDLLKHLSTRLYNHPNEPEADNAFCFAFLLLRTECLTIFFSQLRMCHTIVLPKRLSDFFHVQHIRVIQTLCLQNGIINSVINSVMYNLFNAFHFFAVRVRKNQSINEDRLQRIIDISVTIMPNQFPLFSLAPMLEVVAYCLKHNFSWIRPHHIDFWRCLTGLHKLSHPRLLKNDMLVANMGESYQRFIQHPLFDSNLLGLIDSHIVGSPKEVIPIQSLSSNEIQNFFEEMCNPHIHFETEHTNDPCWVLENLHPSRVMIFWRMAVDENKTNTFNWEKALQRYID